LGEVVGEEDLYGSPEICISFGSGGKSGLVGSSALLIITFGTTVLTDGLPLGPGAFEGPSSGITVVGGGLFDIGMPNIDGFSDDVSSTTVDGAPCDITLLIGF
jgi:hypothetical protein